MPVDQQALPADMRPLPVETPLPGSAPEHASPAAPRQATEAPEQTEVVQAVASPQSVEVPGVPTSVSVDAAPSPPLQDAQEATEQSAAVPAAKLTPWVPAALPDAAAQSTPSSLTTAASASHAASPGLPLAPVLVQIGNASEAPIRESSGAESRKTPPETRPVRRATPTRAMSVSVSVDQQALSTDVQSLLLATPVPDSTPGHAAPTVPGQHFEAPEQKAVVKAAAPPQTLQVPSAPTSVSGDATPSPQAQDAQAAASVQSAARPATELTPQVSATLPETMPQSTPSSLAASASPSHAASPVAQLAPALVQMGHAPDGAQRLTVRLDPPELGQVQVRIDRSSEAAARVEITVEKPETLTLLLRDQPQLQHALDLAGVPAEGRSVTFHIASPEPASRNSEPATAPAPGVAAGGLNNDGSHGAPRQGGQSARQQGPAQDSSETEFTPIGLTGWLRGGLDITA
jgi:flagellar hook-length control protein FliK